MYISKHFNISGFKNRQQAFLYHLLFSVLLAGSILLFAKVAWYPNQLMFATGAIKIFLLVIFVDACFGPLLTLVIYNLKKDAKELKRDFSVIVLLQLCALVYGTYTLIGGRPVYYVFAVDRFELVQANDIPESFLVAKDAGQYAVLPKSGPQWVYAELPEDIGERNDVLFTQVNHGIDLAQTPKYYQPLSEGRETILKKIRPLDVLYTTNDKDRVDQALESLDLSLVSDFGYLPLAGKKADLIVVMNKVTMKIAGVVDLNPWQDSE